jgi:hypothetical protein
MSRMPDKGRLVYLSCIVHQASCTPRILSTGKKADEATETISAIHMRDRNRCHWNELGIKLDCRY